ncbi:hypothetical protein A7982_12513 [Minicystis rosea]|nr:hypothetical protein A7982_12513 [Minicystis rosea]
MRVAAMTYGHIVVSPPMRADLQRFQRAEPRRAEAHDAARASD